MKTNLTIKHCLLIAGLWMAALCATAQQVNDRVIMSSANQAGVPVHPADGDNSYVRWPNGTTGKVTAIGSASQWRQVEVNGQRGWVTTTYLTVLPGDDSEPEEPGNEVQSYVVGSWNLEYFHNNHTRGFPEYTYTPKGPTYQSRTETDFETIAQTIRDKVGAKILVLSEINTASTVKSNELDRLLQHLGGRWGYYLAPTAGHQEQALLFDSSAVTCLKCIEIPVPERLIQGKDIFDRDPLVCHFRFLDHNGASKNDFLVTAVHLASGQDKKINHDTAMAVLAKKLEKVTTDGTFPAGEKDILIAGDYNASRYDNDIEMLWTNTSPALLRFKTMSPENGDDYPGTRLAGVPLIPKSQIDYIMVSSCTGGLLDEVVEPFAVVHLNLVGTNYEEWREHQSDHIPVTVHVKVVADND